MARPLRLALPFAVAALIVSESRAQQIKEKPCSATFAQRRKDAVTAISEATKRSRKNLQLLAWHQEHCRQLTPIEIAVRKIDAAPYGIAFVCDKTPPDRRVLSPKWMIEESGYVAPSEVQRFAARSEECAAEDPVSLDLRGMSIELMVREVTPEEEPARVALVQRWVAVQCDGVKSAVCDAQRATVARLVCMQPCAQASDQAKCISACPEAP